MADWIGVDMTERTCNVPGCEKPTRSKSAELCKMHYHRQYRHGSVHKDAHNTDITASNGRRYKSLYKPGHPLAGASGKVYEHRFVLYEKIGPGPHTCHWCDAEVDWLPKGEPGALVADHLNDYGDDNRPENLAPSCSSCNTTRGAQQRSDALRAAGWWSVNDTVAQLTRGGRRDRIAA